MFRRAAIFLNLIIFCLLLINYAAPPAVADKRVDFGTVPLGMSVRMPLSYTVRGDTDATLIIDKIHIAGVDQADFKVIEDHFTDKPHHRGDTYISFILFTPSKKRAESATLSLDAHTVPRVRDLTMVPTMLSGEGVASPFSNASDPIKKSLQAALDHMQDDLTVQLGEALGLGSPLVLDQRTAYPAVPDLKDFHPAHLQISSIKDLLKPLPPGDYSLWMTGFCTQASIHAPGQGVPYKIGRVQGKQASAISALLVRGTLLNISPTTLNNEAWRIQAGLPLRQWPNSDQVLAHRLIPDYENGLEEDILQKIPVEKNGLIAKLQQTRKTLSDKTITAQNLPDRVFERASGDTLSRTLPSASNPQPSPWSEIQPGVYARFTVIKGNLGRNLFEFRIMPEAVKPKIGFNGFTEPQNIFAAFTPQGTTILGVPLVTIVGYAPAIVGRGAIIVGGVFELPALATVGSAVLVTYSTLRAAQSLVLMVQMGGNGGATKGRYTKNPAHDENDPNYNPNKDPLPPDAEEVYKDSISDPDGRKWWGKSTNGDYYRYSDSNDGTVHFSGRFTPTQAKSGGIMPSSIWRYFNP